MYEKHYQKYKELIVGMREIMIEAYVSSFDIPSADDLKDADFDVLAAVATAVAGDFFMAKEGAVNPYHGILTLIAKANGAQGVMFIGGNWPTPAELGVKELELYSTADGKTGVGTGKLNLPKKEDLH